MEFFRNNRKVIIAVIVITFIFWMIIPVAMIILSAKGN